MYRHQSQSLYLRELLFSLKYGVTNIQIFSFPIVGTPEECKCILTFREVNVWRLNFTTPDPQQLICWTAEKYS